MVKGLGWLGHFGQPSLEARSGATHLVGEGRCRDSPALFLFGFESLGIVNPALGIDTDTATVVHIGHSIGDTDGRSGGGFNPTFLLRLGFKICRQKYDNHYKEKQTKNLTH
jgi:hypothetical protein